MRRVPNAMIPALEYIVKALDNGELLGESMLGETVKTATITTDAHKSAQSTVIAMRLGTSIQVRVNLPDCLEEDIDMLELLAIVGAVQRWGPRLKGHRLVCGCDNAGVVEWVNSGRSARDDVLNLLKELYECEKKFGLKVIAQWLPRWFNYTNDRIAGLSEREACAIDPRTICESTEGSPDEALRQIRVISSE